jgi:redox-sensitive bicupin YhaK (pirin superfamily)
MPIFLAGSAKIIAGDFVGTKGAATTYSHIDLWDVTINPGQQTDLLVPEDHNTSIFVRVGAVQLCDRAEPIAGPNLALLSRAGRSVCQVLSSLFVSVSVSVCVSCLPLVPFLPAMPSSAFCCLFVVVVLVCMRSYVFNFSFKVTTMRVFSVVGQPCLLMRVRPQIRLSTVGDTPVNILVLSGQPLDEPIAAQGPFVMNTQIELRQAMADFHSGNFGR